MNNLDYWRLCDELSIDQAAHLVIGMCPGEKEAMEATGAELMTRSAVTYYTNLQAARTAISNAVRGGRLLGTRRMESGQQWDSVAEAMIEVVSDELDLERSTVMVDDLKRWLWDRGVRSGFFFPDGEATADYLNPQHPRYAPKLAAAVKAWMAVDDPRGKTPKQALTKWLREHGVEFGLSDDEGKPNEQGIEECAKVANWQPGGGAPKTPGS